MSAPSSAHLQAAQIVMPWLDLPEPESKRRRLEILRDVPLQHEVEHAHEDFDRPVYRKDCEAFRLCPHCDRMAAMRVRIDGDDAVVTCPHCSQRVYYHNDGADAWHWGTTPQAGTHVSEGLNHTRPCPFVSCKYHLAIDVVWAKSREKIAITFPDRDLSELADSCALDVAGADHESFNKQQPGTHQSLERIGDAINVTRERVRQLETVILEKLREVAE